jgi:hypothetical protein
MSHAEGKIEVVGKTDRQIFFKFHRAADDQDSGRFMIRRCNPHAHWFDDYQQPGLPATVMDRYLDGSDGHRAQAGMA